MKKLFSLFIILCLVFCFTGCKYNKNKNIQSMKYVVCDDGSNITLKIYKAMADEPFQTIPYYTGSIRTDKAYYFEDVNFDGIRDLLLPEESPASAIYFSAYNWNDRTQQFELIDYFSNIPNPVVDNEEEVILSYRTESQITSYGKYAYKNGTFELVASIYWQPAYLIEDSHNVSYDNLDKIFFYEERNDETKELYVCSDGIGIDYNDSKISEYVKANSFWDLKSKKWQSYFFKIKE